MIAVDTSILVRYFVQDDVRQAALATELLEAILTAERPGLITVVTLHETAWVLQRVYKLDWNRVKAILAALLDVPNLVIERPQQVARALAADTGFGDALIHFVANDMGATKTVTFDRKFARFPGVELLV